MDLLARRDHSRTELQRKLALKGYAPNDIHITLETLLTEGLLSDARFAENYLHYRRNKGYGPRRIQVELQARGIAEDLIDHLLKISDNAWGLALSDLLRKRFKNKLPRDFKERAKQMRFLQYRGFTTEQIINIYHNDAEHA